MLIRSYRVRGHLEAQLDPLGLQQPKSHPELDPRTYGFTEADWDRPIFIDDVLGLDTATVRQIMAVCAPPIAARSASSSCTSRTRTRIWLRAGWKARPGATAFDAAKKRRILDQLNEAEGFETFCQKNYVTTKRFGLEGGEITIPALDAIIERGGEAGVKRDRDGHAPSRPAQHAGEHRQEALRQVFSEFEGVGTSPTTCRARAT